MKKHIFLTLSVLFICGCAADGIHDYNSLTVAQDHVTEPTPANQFIGLLTATSEPPSGSLERRAFEICSSRGGLKSSPQFAFRNNIWGWNIYRYQCQGQSTRAVAQVPIQSPAQIPSPPQAQKGLVLEDAKSKCLDLGFSKDTEGFGKCVLRLTR